MSVKKTPLFTLQILRTAIADSFIKLNPFTLSKNPVIFVCEVIAVITTLDLMFKENNTAFHFELQISLWLWFTVLFANFAEAIAEGRGKAQAVTLKQVRSNSEAHLLSKDKTFHKNIPASSLVEGDFVVVSAGELIPADGEVIQGIAAVDESAITGESAPVIREFGGDRNSVTGGTRVISDQIVIRVTANPGDSFLDHIIQMVENASRQKTPNEISMTILLSSITIIFLTVVISLKLFAVYSGIDVSLTVLAALLVCLIPTTIGGLLSAIGIAGMGRMIQANVIAMSGRAVEAAGDIDVLLLDKTGTITLGNRQASAFIPMPGVDPHILADIAQLASLADETPEGRSIVVFAKTKYGLRERKIQSLGAYFVPFTALTRMSGVDLDDRKIRKGAPDAIKGFVESEGGVFLPDVQKIVEEIAQQGATPLVVAEGKTVLGVIQLKDIIKGGVKERFAEMRQMGIRTIMITGDNMLTAASVAAEAGMDDFLAETNPQAKMELIRKEQDAGHFVAMAGDGTNDAPALAQADVAVAMNTGTPAAKEAGNLVDLDSNPSKLIEIIKIGKQMLMTRGALTTFSIAADIAKYFAIIPAILIQTFPMMNAMNVMYLDSPQGAILSAVIFNALIIVIMIPLALSGVRFRPMNANQLLLRNILVFGLGGLIAPFIGIKLIDMVISRLHLL